MSTQIDTSVRKLSWTTSDQCDDLCSSGAVLVDVGQQYRPRLLVRQNPTVLFRHELPRPSDSLACKIPEVPSDFMNFKLQRSNVSTPDSVPGLCPQDSCFGLRSFELAAPNCETLLHSTAKSTTHPNEHRLVANDSLYIQSSGPKSDNIAIKRSRRDMNSLVDNSMERMYECATWRMYHRIISSRRAKPPVVPLDRNNNQCNPTEDQFDFGTSPMDESLEMDATQRLDDCPQPTSHFDFEGEVFTIDL